MIKVVLSFIALFLANAASAHTGMEHSAVLHSSIHLIIAMSIFVVTIAAGFYLYRALPKAKPIRIKK